MIQNSITTTPTVEQEVEKLYAILLASLENKNIDTTTEDRILTADEVVQFKDTYEDCVKTDVNEVRRRYESFKEVRKERYSDHRKLILQNDLAVDNLMQVINTSLAELTALLALIKYYNNQKDNQTAWYMVSEAKYLLGQVFIATLLPINKMLEGSITQNKRKVNADPRAQEDKKMILLEFDIWQNNPDDYPDQETFLKEMLKECKFYETLTTKTLRQWRSKKD